MITREMSISDVLMKKPKATQLLMSYGICNCCGGNLTLKESAESKGVDLEMLLERINKN